MKTWRGAFVAMTAVAAMLALLLAFGGRETATTPVSAPSGPASDSSTTTLQVLPTLAPPDGSERATVVRIVDGDTVEVVTLAGDPEVVRLIGINTPESGECYSERSSVALGTLLSEEVVTMTADTTDRDQYGRLLRYLWLDRGVFVNEIMVRGGFAQARDFPPDSMYADEIAAAQDLARADALGIWADDSCGPSAGDDLRVIDVLADPPGSDIDNLEGEWADIVNAGLADVAMREWVLKDESSRHRYTFPDGFVIAPQTTVRVRTGCGIDDEENLHWCLGSAVWNNAGDTAFLLDPYGNIVSFYEY